jgi:transcriptional activator SPT8
MTITNVDIIPVVSAVHPNPIYCLAATENQKWIVTGSEDGFIRKYDFYSSLNGSTLLTGAQKHGLVDSIQKAGVILSAWENEDGTQCRLTT